MLVSCTGRQVVDGPGAQAQEKAVKIVQTVLGCTEEQIVDVPVPQYHEGFVELVVDIPQEHTSERIVEPIRKKNVRVVQIV